LRFTTRGWLRRRLTPPATASPPQPLAESRSTALFQPATELPAAVLAGTLGIDLTVAVKWQQAAAGDWATYAAEISRRTPPQHPIHEPGVPT
ncbi:hypothetical protein ACWD25_61595, partial [Streptomyces sp. NPDC002920]